MAVEPAVYKYIASLPDERRETCARCTSACSRRCPSSTCGCGASSSATAASTTATTPVARGDWFPIGLTNNKRYVSLYICAADDDGYLAERNAERLGKVSVGKSCIRFTKLENLDLDVAGELCRRAAELVAAGRFAM